MHAHDTRCVEPRVWSLVRSILSFEKTFRQYAYHARVNLTSPLAPEPPSGAGSLRREAAQSAAGSASGHALPAAGACRCAAAAPAWLKNSWRGAEAEAYHLGLRAGGDGSDKTTGSGAATKRRQIYRRI